MSSASLRQQVCLCLAPKGRGREKKGWSTIHQLQEQVNCTNRTGSSALSTQIKFYSSCNKTDYIKKKKTTKQNIPSYKVSHLFKRMEKYELLPNVLQPSYTHLHHPTSSFLVVLLNGALLLPCLPLFAIKATFGSVQVLHHQH